MTTFQRYEFRDLSKPQEIPESGVKPYREPHFDIHRDASKVDSIHQKADHFRLDKNVSSQLGIEERERQAAEERIKREIERRWEQMSEKAEVAGYTKGLEEGKEEAYKAELPRIQEKVQKLEHLLSEIDTFREKIFSANEAFLMDLIAQVAGMIALKEVALDQDYVRRLVTALLKQLGTKEDLKIFLSPQDAANAETLFQALQKEFGKLNNTTIEASEEIPVGGCRIETRFGVVDSSIAAQIDNVMRSLKA